MTLVLKDIAELVKHLKQRYRRLTIYWGSVIFLLVKSDFKQMTISDRNFVIIEKSKYL